MPTQSGCREASSTPDENILPLNAQTSPADLYKLARRFQIERNAARSEVTSLRRKFVDVTNTGEDEEDSERAQLSKRARTSPPANDDGPEEEENEGLNATDERFVYHAGHKYGLTCSLWVHEGDGIFDIEVDEDYEPGERFETDKTKVQGQFQEIVGLLRVRLGEDTIRQRWVRRRFIEAVNEQRFNTATRLRKHCAPIFGVAATDLLKSEDRKAFRDQIGWVVDDNGRGSYSTVDVKILHKDYHGQYSPSSAFLNPVLMSLPAKIRCAHSWPG